MPAPRPPAAHARSIETARPTSVVDISGRLRRLSSQRRYTLTRTR